MNFEVGKRYLDNKGKQYIYAGKYDILRQKLQPKETEYPINWGIYETGYRIPDIRKNAIIITDENPIYLNVKVAKKDEDVFFTETKDGHLNLIKGSNLKKRLTGVSIPELADETIMTRIKNYLNCSLQTSRLNPEPIIIPVKYRSESTLWYSAENYGYVLVDGKPAVLRYNLNVNHETYETSIKMTLNGKDITDQYINKEEFDEKVAESVKVHDIPNRPIIGNPEIWWKVQFDMSCYVWNIISENFTEIIFRYGTVNQDREIPDVEYNYNIYNKKYFTLTQLIGENNYLIRNNIVSK